MVAEALPTTSMCVLGPLDDYTAVQPVPVCLYTTPKHSVSIQHLGQALGEPYIEAEEAILNTADGR